MSLQPGIHGSNIRVLFNDAHSSLHPQRHIAQGGPSKFAGIFFDYFNKKTSGVELISLLFSHNKENENIFIRKTKRGHYFYEVVYPRKILLSSYKKTFSKKGYIEYLKPILVVVNKIFEDARPDVVFLNGFSLSNWIILEMANRRNVPVCIQHAGIWKKEIQATKGTFSPSIRKIFFSFENDVFKKTAHQIFLNKFSRNVFFKLHNIPLLDKNLANTSIVPLPVALKNQTKKISILKSKKTIYNIGMIARWDSIKNHPAIFRLATYIKKHDLSFSVRVVTQWPEDLESNFKTKYEKVVQIVKPMDVTKLSGFYRSQDVIIIPSRFDVSPTVLMEALSLAKPVIISSNVGWFSDFKKYKLNDLIISPNLSGKGIMGKIDYLIKNMDKYAPRFEQLRQKINNEHNPKKVFTKYYEIFKSIA